MLNPLNDDHINAEIDRNRRTVDRRKVNDDDVKASGFRALEGIGTVRSCAIGGNKLRMTIETCGITCKLSTSAKGAGHAAKIDLVSVGDRVLFRARPTVVDGTTIHVGIIEVGALGAAGGEFCVWNVEQWTHDGFAVTGDVRLQFPEPVRRGEPWSLALRADDGRILWTPVGDTPVEPIIH